MKRTSWFGWRRRSRPSPITLAVDSVDLARRGLDGLAVERHDELAEGRAHAVDRAGAAGRAEPDAGAGELACAGRDRGPGRSASAASSSAHRRARRRVGIVEPHRMAGTAARCGRDVARRAPACEQQRRRALGVGAGRTDPHRDRHARARRSAATSRATPTSIAPRRVDLQHEQRRPAFVRLA